ncbi:crossover junction endonuclease EME1 [Anoplophora glabripennis]|uniref:crossover junction endonuclease EME1 n=1 Tax=Anoplophora glabripennis TaxID=217634 RepID=UPI0008751DE7|nr:crossover junction endonuclease EME1 [Anoplophora glabripennis]
MTNCRKSKMDISSDSEDTIIVDNEPSDSEIEDILKKYTIPTTSSYSLNNSNGKGKYLSEELYSSHEQAKITFDNYAFKSFDVEDDVIDLELNNKSCDELEPQEAVEIKKQQDIESKRKGKTLKKSQKLQDAEMRKVAKTIEKERKKEALQKQKMIKNALKSVAKSIKPEECIKYVIVEIDPDMFDNEYGTILKEAFQKRDINFRTKSQVLPNLISWSRKIQTIDDKVLRESEVNESHFLLIIHATEFMEHIKKDTLTVYIGNVFSLTEYKQLTVVVVGLEKPKPPQEMPIIEVQMSTKAYFRFAENAESLADILLEVTKAISQIPYKLKKEEKYNHHNEYFHDSNKDTVKIDKNGNGLGRLWHQMLTMFPLARLETAEAITAVYPTPASLFQAYEISEKKVDLLQDLSIRRAQGPLISGRRIGPELSRKCYNFFCATENTFL